MCIHHSIDVNIKKLSSRLLSMTNVGCVLAGGDNPVSGSSQIEFITLDSLPPGDTRRPAWFTPCYTPTLHYPLHRGWPCTIVHCVINPAKLYCCIRGQRKEFSIHSEVLGIRLHLDLFDQIRHKIDRRWELLHHQSINVGMINAGVWQMYVYWSPSELMCPFVTVTTSSKRGAWTAANY